MEKKYAFGITCLYIMQLVAIYESSRYDGYKVFKVGPLKDMTEVNKVQELIDWKTRQVIPLTNEDISVGHTALILVSSQKFRSVRQSLRRHRIIFVSGDYGRNSSQGSSERKEELEVSLTSAQHRTRQPLLMHETLEEKQPDHTRYLSYDEQISWLQQKVASSSVTQMYSLADTYQNRSIPCILINFNKPNLPMIWIDANLRASEWISSAVALYLIDQILNGASDDPVFLRSNFRIIIVPNANPDGYEYSRLVDRKWVKNRQPNSLTSTSSCVGTDLMRNFGIEFGVYGTSDDPCDDRYHGPGEFSEPETRGIDDILMGYSQDLKMYFSLQAYGQQWLLPFAYRLERPADYNELARVANLAVRSMQLPSGRVYAVGAESDFTGQVSGKPNDYSKIYAQIPYSYVINLRPETAADGGVEIPPSNIIPNGQEVLAGIGEACREAHVLPP